MRTDLNPHEIRAKEQGCFCDRCPIATLREGVPSPQDYGVIARSSVTPQGEFSTYDGIIVVGEIPTFNDKQGSLSGRAKRNWKEALDKSGLSSLNLLLVPSVHCVPSNVLKKSDRIKVVHSCRPSAMETINSHPNIPILLMGSDAIATYGLNKKLNENRGFLFNTDAQRDANNRPFIITYAATTVMFGNIYMWGTFIEDLRRFYRLITNTLKSGLLPSMVDCGVGAGGLTQFLRRAHGQPIAVDIETTSSPEHPEWGLDATKATLKTIAFGTTDFAASVHFTATDFATRVLIRSILEDESITKVFHNGPWFDLRVLERYGINTTNWRDTRDLRRAISSTSRLSLSYLGSLYCDIHAWKLDDNNEKLSQSEKLEDLLLYNGYDTIVTARIYHAMMQGM